MLGIAMTLLWTVGLWLFVLGLCMAERWRLQNKAPMFPWEYEPYLEDAPYREGPLAQ